LATTVCGMVDGIPDGMLQLLTGTVTTAVDGTEAITLLETQAGTSELATITADDSDQMV